MIAMLILAGSAQAQRTGDGFMFGEPRGSLTVRGGFAHANAGSDIFSFTTSRLTIDRRDFSGRSAGGDVALRIAHRLDLAVSGSWSGRTTKSEFRDWVDQDDLPIRQTTFFARVPVTAGLRAYLLPRGRAIGRYAWIPARFTAYVGGGVGVMWYQFRQRGDFVHFETLAVFPDRFESRGLTPTAQGLAGVELTITPRFALTAEGRYSMAKAGLSNDFDGFDRIDLSGPSATLGVTARFSGWSR